jgi:tetratricopeptide (TPR) repeat protein
LVIKVAKKKKKKRRRRSGKSASPQLRERDYQSGLSYFREGEYEQAIRAWRGVVGNSEPNLAAQLAEAYFRNAMSKYESGNVKAVISELHSALKYDSSQPVYLFHIGLAYHRMGKLPQAISYYTRATEAAPEHGQDARAPEVERYRYHLGLAHLQNGEIQESIKFFEAVSGIHGRIGEILTYISQGDHERALKVLNAAHDGNELKFLEGFVYLAQENDRKAKSLLKTAADNGMGNGVPDYYLGVTYARTDAMSSAIEAWEDAFLKGLDIEFMKDDMASVYRQLAARYFDREDLSKVVEIWEKLLEVEHGRSCWRWNRGTMRREEIWSMPIFSAGMTTRRLNNLLMP